MSDLKILLTAEIGKRLDLKKSVNMRVKGIKIKDCEGKSLVPSCSKISALDITATTIFERFYLVCEPRQFFHFVTMPSAPTYTPLTHRLFLDFRAIFSPSGA